MARGKFRLVRQRPFGLTIRRQRGALLREASLCARSIVPTRLSLLVSPLAVFPRYTKRRAALG